ncbi:probable disease resistance protein At5g43730 [Cajanus cajan]|uniref:probable disease resistance protein At5g43730 n=1 Tax=Cajanus cajan TaxID=3821 RepID=UPI0010FB565F|nr:probable disease resistance protein At5g43730 [Cajanus cajan]
MMGRPKGDKYYWNQVTIEENGKWKCKHCNRVFSGGFTRIKAHVDQTKGKGIAVCVCSVDGGNERVLSTSDSNNPRLTESQCSVAEHVVRGSNNVNGIFQSEINDLNKLVSDLTSVEDDIKGQLQWLESRGKKRKSNVNNWLNELQNLKKRVVDMNNSLDVFGLGNFYELEIEQWVDKLQQHEEIRQLTVEMQRHKIQKPVVLSNEFVGEDFEHDVQIMWTLLEDVHVFIIGIHGMGGVGKTFFATYMENEIKRKATFNHVFWVTVSHDFTIFKLQQDIAERIGVKLCGDDERSRATILASELEKIEKSVLILDDVWKYIDLEKVGIPLRMNGIKLIITSRLKHVYRQMDCQSHNIITIYPLQWSEARELFSLKLGHHGTPATLTPEVLEIARFVGKEFNGLPLGIILMARTIKGCYDTYMWRHALNKLKKMGIGEEVKEVVLTVLKRSYDNLVEKDMQKFFLHCSAVLPNTFDRSDLVVTLLNNGFMKEKGNLEEIFDEGHDIVNKLIDHSLLLDLEDCSLLEMHNLVTDMACHILNESHSYMVKCKQELRKIPHVQEWTVDLELVYLANNMIEEIPEGTSPNCPRLSSLILTNNRINHIPECFFTDMNALTVLDLSYNDAI